MQINQNNYEAFFLDFVEGRLDNSSTLELLNFLRNHPELKQELESFSDIRLNASEDVFPGKDFLKKMDFGQASVNPNNFCDFCIAYHEKLLSNLETQKLFLFLESHPEKKKDFELFGKTTLVADKNIVFEAKPFLKKKMAGAKLRTIVFRLTAVAAGFILAVTIYYRASVKDNAPNRIAVTTLNKQKLTVNEQSQNTDVDVLPKIAKNLTSNSKPKSSMFNVDPEKKSEIVSHDQLTQDESLTELANIDLKSIPNIPFERHEFKSAANVVSPDLEEKDDFELFAYAQKLIQKNILKQDDDKPRKKITLWDLADVTLKGYNSISENDIKLHKETDQNGKITAFAIETDSKKYGFSNKN